MSSMLFTVGCVDEGAECPVLSVCGVDGCQREQHTLVADAVRISGAFEVCFAQREGGEK